MDMLQSGKLSIPWFSNGSVGTCKFIIKNPIPPLLSIAFVHCSAIFFRRLAHMIQGNQILIIKGRK